MAELKPYPLVVGLIVLIWLTKPTLAFGAGNIASISKVEGQNWRHGDIEDALLTLTMAEAISGKKFNKLQVSRVYFGNWLRDYSQAIDVGTVKSVSAEAVRLLLCVLAFMTFGYGSGEFEVTAERLGCYRPEDHIDNPKNYADNEDARQYDRRLRAPIDEETELAVDPESGMKNYIANERAGCMTSAKHLRNLFGKSIRLGRRYAQSGDKRDKYECLRLMGTGLHCLEDFFAHSNYTELALIEMGEHDVFPHVGRDTKLELEGARSGSVYPLVTGTFGGVDFLHSVTGEVSDKLTQNEIDELTETLQQGQKADTSVLRGLLDMIPDGIFGGTHESDKVDEIQANASASQVQQMSVSPREPEEYTLYIKQVFESIMPAIEFHDEVVKNISRTMDSIPVLPKILGQLEEQLSMFVFSIIAPFILPVVDQIRNELKTGSDEIIESSEREQHIVFEDDYSTDPTHSMLSKDHFSNVLNEIAGRAAAHMVHWVVPQLMEAMDDESIDEDRTITRIIYGVMAHPAQRDMGHDGIHEGRRVVFNSVKEWWNEMSDDRRDDYRRKLTRRAVKNGDNHKEGVQDTGHGHGCVGKLKMRKMFGEPEGGLEDRIAEAAAGKILEGASGAFSGLLSQATGGAVNVPQYRQQQERHESSSQGGLMGAASGILGGVFGGGDNESHSRRRDNDGGYHEQTRTEYRRYEQEEYDGGRETRSYGYEEHSERRHYEGSTEEGHHRRRRDDEDEGGGFGGLLGDVVRGAEQAFGDKRGW